MTSPNQQISENTKRNTKKNITPNVEMSGGVEKDKESSIKIFEDLVEKFKCLQTDAAEFSCLKALVLFNPGLIYSNYSVGLPST